MSLSIDWIEYHKRERVDSSGGVFFSFFLSLLRAAVVCRVIIRWWRSRRRNRRVAKKKEDRTTLESHRKGFRRCWGERGSFRRRPQFICVRAPRTLHSITTSAHPNDAQHTQRLNGAWLFYIYIYISPTGLKKSPLRVFSKSLMSSLSRMFLF